MRPPGEGLSNLLTEGFHLFQTILAQAILIMKCQIIQHGVRNFHFETLTIGGSGANMILAAARARLGLIFRIDGVRCSHSD